MKALLLALLLAAPDPGSVRFPDLSGLETAVAAQLGEMQRLLVAHGEEAGAYGELGQVYLAYGFHDAAAALAKGSARSSGSTLIGPTCHPPPTARSSGRRGRRSSFLATVRR